MPSQKRIELLLTSNVENLGIVGDVVRVRMGYARNYLLPMGVAETPTQENTLSHFEEFTRAEILGLWDYLRKSRNQGFVISISGGSDSATIAETAN